MLCSSDTIDRAERLVACGEYQQAIRMLSKLVRIPAVQYSDADLARLYYLLAVCSFKLGETSEAYSQVTRALDLGKRIVNDGLYADMKFYKGVIEIDQGHLDCAAEEFNEAYVYYRRTDSHKDVTLALSQLAHVFFLKGNLARASEYLTTDLSYSREHGLDEQVPVIVNNLCKVALLRGKYNELATLLGELGKCSLTPDRRIHMLFSESLRLIHLLQLDSAIDTLRNADDLCKSSGTLVHHIILCEYLGLLEYSRGNYSKAREYYQKVLDMPEPTASAVAQTLRMLTDVCIAEGNFDEAMATAKKAEKAITKINERIELGALYRAYGQIYTPRKNHETARDYFGRSITLLREIGARYELALTYFVCGESKSYSVETRMRHLESARLLFDEMGVPKRVEQVQSAIDELKLQSVPDIIIPHEDSARTMVAASTEMKRLVSLADKVARSNLTVLLTGETGVGKDLLARYIHEASGRKGEFVPMNAAAIPQEMIESELFGCRVGAFTGAIESRAGLFERAEGGTFYLNEIADATPAFQAKLLEVLETHEVRRLGETNKRHVDFRLIAATNRDLEQEVEDGRFRSDLFYRLNEISLVVPPLRERKDDISALVMHFMSSLLEDICSNGNKGNVSAFARILSHRHWTGNIRELRSEVNRLWVESRCDIVMMVNLAQEYQIRCQMNKLTATLEDTGWNRRETARRLGVSDTTVRNWIKKHNLA